MTKLQAEFTSYMKIALKHDSIDYFRKQNKKHNIEVLSINDKEVSVPQISGSGTFHFFKDYISNEKLFLAINNLTKKQQEILFMYADNISLNDIAIQLNISVGTVKATIFQIKKKIRKYMGEF